MNIYLAYPIDQARRGEPELVHYIACLVRQAEQESVALYLPDRPWEGVLHLPTIVDVNNHVLDRSSAMVAVLPDGVPTLGVPIEIERALGDSKDVIVICGAGPMNTAAVADWARRGAEVTNVPDGAIARLKAKWRERGCGGAGPAINMKVDSGGRMPTRAYSGDAGYDLYTVGEWWIHVGEFLDVPVGVSAELPPGVWGWIVGRSSTLRQRRLLVNQGIIDQGYRGELFVGVQNIGQHMVHIKDGDRIAQLIPLPLLAEGLRLTQVAELNTSDRGTNGFGSSGR